VARDAVTFRPFAVPRQVMRAEQPVEEREVDREIDVDRFLLDPVMPVVEARHDEDLLEEAVLAPTFEWMKVE
jgi:hypothetical protein